MYWSVAVADLNGDGKPDIAVSYTFHGTDLSSSQGFVAVFLQDTAKPGTFLAPTKYSVGEQPVSIAIGDINGDGKPDIITVNTALSSIATPRAHNAAFLLKGPARFAPMDLNHLGKNNDQIYRLSKEPAGLLVVQHCHDILSPVRATLRAFAVQPSNPRRYCLIDGRDSLRLLQAYGLYDRALEMSR